MTVYVSVVEITLGVPEITPVAVLNESPAGKLGEMFQEEAVPVTLGASGVMAVPTVKVLGELYESATGAASFTVITTPKVVDPPEFVAVTV